MSAEFNRLRRQVLRDGARPQQQRDEAMRLVVLSIPAGRVSTYGKVAAAAGYPLHHRAAARLLRTEPPDTLPWYRVVGAGGAIKLHDAAGEQQRQLLALEGVTFRGKLVDMEQHEHAFRLWEER